MVDWKQLLKYALVGVSGLIVNTGCLYLLTEYVGIFYLVSGVIASEISIITNFLLNDKFTFSNDGVKYSRRHRFILYNSVSLIGTYILMICMFILTEHFGIYYIYANWCGVGIVFCINYILNKHITWKL